MICPRSSYLHLDSFNTLTQQAVTTLTYTKHGSARQ